MTQKISKSYINMNDAENLQVLHQDFLAACSVLRDTYEVHNKTIIKVASSIVTHFRSGGKAIVFGNGGSYADALHFVGELEGAYRNRERAPLPAIAPNPVSITAIGNDFGYEDTFKKFVMAHAKINDIVIGISTSGNSPNVVRALQYADKKKIVTVGMTGESGGEMKKYCNYLLNIPSTDTPRIQEAYKFAIHEICDIVEREMFGSGR